MQIRFINHASFEVSTPHVRLVTDPWFSGRVFKDGWDLLSRTAFSYDDFRDVTHIWFSHEHPDHFHPPTLNRIPQEHRARITVLFQETVDRKVADFCRKAGFGRIQELPAHQPVQLAEDLEILCGPWESFADSWICMRSGGQTLLNVNDCTVDTLEQARSIKDLVGDVDVLFTQYAISAWDGNEEELSRRLAGAQTMLDRTVMQTQVFGARWVVPFASFIWFCHRENYFMNTALTPIDTVAAAVEAECEAVPVVLYPGDVWRVGSEHDTQHAVERYLVDFHSLPQRTLSEVVSCDARELIEASVAFCRALSEEKGRFRLAVSLVTRGLRQRHEYRDRSLWESLRSLLQGTGPRAKVHVIDLQSSFDFDLKDGLRPAGYAPEECDLQASSDSLLFAFQFLWGGETLILNGRFRENRPDSRRALFDYFHLAGYLNSRRSLAQAKVC